MMSDNGNQQNEMMSPAEYMQYISRGPLTAHRLHAIGLRGNHYKDEELDERGKQVYEQIINRWLHNHPDPVNQRSATGMSNRDVLETAQGESASIRKLARRTLAQFEAQMEFERWQWDLIADLYLQISALDDLLADALKGGE